MKRQQYIKYFIKSILWMFLLPAIHAQVVEEARHFEFDGDDTFESTVTYSYKARDYITLKSGTTISPASGNTFTAQIDESVVLDMDYLTGGEIPDADNRNINTSLPVGTTPGSFGVSSSGAATYSIPIYTPPGTAGMEPTLSLTYNSQAGNGLLGVGWNLSGISAITRVPSTIYHDGEVDGVDFDSKDKFAMDGNRLILTSTDKDYGEDGSKYMTEMTDFSVITAEGASGNGPSSFLVETKDGKTLKYGYTSDSRIEAQGKSDVLLWYISEITDVHGNYIKYEYFEDNTNGIFYPKNISYTGNVGLSPYNKVEFFYETRDDKNISYAGGSQVNQKMLLQKIKVSSEDEKIKEYYLQYANDFYSHLVKVEEYGNDGSTRNATIFEWGETANDNNSVKTSFSGHNYYFYSGDFNGDAKTDVIKIPKKATYDVTDKWELYLNTPTGFVKPGNGEGNLISDLYDITSFELHYFWLNQPFNMVLSDFNGDGLDDFLRSGFAPEDGVEIFEDTWYYIPMISYGSTTTETYFHESAYVLFQEENQPFLGDFDGDNLVEMLVYKKTSEEWVLVEFTGSQQKFTLTGGGVIGDDDKLMPGDYDGDGKMELYHFHSSGYKIYNLDVISSHLETVPGSSYPSRNHSVFLGDYNGDRKSDALTYKSTEGWKLAYFDGDDFTESSECPGLSTDPEASDNNDNYYLGDYNGDGKMDFLKTWKDGSNNCYADFFHSKGIGFHTPKSVNLTTNNNIYKHWFITGDYNGDGNMDILYYSETDSKHISYLNNPAGTDQLTEVFTNGMNLTKKLSYSPLPISDHYAQGTYSSPSGVIDFKGALYLAEEVATRDEYRDINYFTKEYNYYGAKMHRLGKGFLGFMETKEKNVTYLTETRNVYSINPTYYQRLIDLTQSYHNSVLISETDLTPKLRDPNTGDGFNYYFSFMEKQVNTDKLTNNSTTITQTYDNSGNITENKTEYKEGSTLVSTTKINYNDYVDAIAGDNNTYHNKPQEIITTKNRGGENFVRQTDIDYNDDGTIDTKIMDPGKTKAVTTSNLYYTSGYKKGMLLKSTISATGHDDRYINYEYDSKGRYLTKETDALGNWTEYNYNNKWGKVETQTGSDGVIVNNSYDGFGRLVSTSANTGESALTTYTWDDLSTPDDSRYFVTTTHNDGGYAREYFDILGRSLRTETKKFDGTIVYADTKYQAEGKTEWVSEPYISGTPNKSTYHYLDDGRIDYIEHPTATMDYSYTGATVTVTNTSVSPQQSSSKTYDALGNIKSATDHGGTITYNYHANGQPSSIVTGGHTVSMGYDQYGMQDTLNDPDAGLMVYDYTPFGELKMQRDARQSSGEEYTMTYDQLGRIKTKTGLDGTTTWEYYVTGNGKGKLKKIYKSGTTNSIEYEYDEYSRLVKEIHTYDTKTFEYEYEYDSKNRISRMKYPSGFWIKYVYNANGYLSEIRRDDGYTNIIWQGNNTNARGQWTQYQYGNNLVTKKSYDSYGYPVTIKTGTSQQETSVQYSEYDFYTASGNLRYRLNRKHIHDSYPLIEGFIEYDKLNRLTTYGTKVGAVNDTVYMNYEGSIGNTNGCIASKSDIGEYQYQAPNSPHAVSSVLIGTGGLGGPVDTIGYTPFNKINYIKKTESLPYTYTELTIDYDPYQQRRKTVLSNMGNTLETKYFVDNYEVIVDESTGNEKKLHYIYGGPGLLCIMEQTGTTKGFYYVHSDYLGSIEYVTDQNGSLEQELSYDPWGRLRNPVDWSYSSIPSPKFGRGFTTHEHLDEFNLINMNGRVYDPVLGVFLSPDNYVQWPDFTQNFNRYGYALNNPLKYSDPTGDWFLPVLGTVIGAYFGGVQANNYELNPGDWKLNFNTMYSVVSGGITGYGVGYKIENFIHKKNYSKNLGEIMQKRLSNSDYSLVNNENPYNAPQPYPVQVYNNEGLNFMDIMELYDMSYQELDALNPGKKLVWNKNEWFNVNPPKKSNMPLGFPPDPTKIPFSSIFGIFTDSPMSAQNWFVPVGQGSMNRAYFQPNFGIWEWQWSVFGQEKQITLFGNYSRASVGEFSKIKWRGIYPFDALYLDKRNILFRESINSLLTLLIR